MAPDNDLKQRLISHSFLSIFSNKGYMGSVAEKAKINYKAKDGNKAISQSRLHYFAIGHAFKQINTKTIFKYQLNEDEKKEIPTAFPALQIDAFNFKQDDKDNLYQLIEDLRNLNAHYLHDFVKINVQNIDSHIIQFLKESFELALIQSCYKLEIQNQENDYAILSMEEKQKILEDIMSVSNERILKDFIKKIFYQTLYIPNGAALTDDQKQVKRQIKLFVDKFETKDDLIDWILFKELSNDLEWKLNKDGNDKEGNNSHILLNIPKGKYLSYEACLFLLTMFLYKNEANLLIPRLRGFKKNGNAQDESKLEAFRLFAKKFKGQDIDSNESHLVKSRDIIQYLTKYPIAWNAELEKENNVVTDELKQQIQKIELKRLYGEYINEDKFYLYAKESLFNNTNSDIVSLTEKDISRFETKINMSDKLKGCYKKLEDQEKKMAKENNSFKREKMRRKISDTKKEIHQIEASGKKMYNRNTEKLRLKIQHNSLYQTYGRNQDRFMEFAIRFLSEHDYFGEETQFKMYQFYTVEEQEQYLKEQERKINFDKLKFHGSRLVHFTTFANHLKNYPEWDIPFVIENNAVYIKLPNEERIICLQRGLMIYLLQHNLQNEKLNSDGNALLIEYLKIRKTDLNAASAVLSNQTKISVEQKTGFKKLLPRRLLNHYAPSVINSENVSALKALLNKTEQMEQRYAQLLKDAKDTGYLLEFEKKNKGKNFKLNFIRKAWNIMYFRDIYMKSKEFSKQQEHDLSKNKEHEKGHHKSQHITREEFNNFSRWMYAFDEAPRYKSFLRALFDQKSFLANEEFSRLFDQSHSLEDLYKETKEKYKTWLNNEIAESKPDKYQYDNYKELLHEGVVHINISHFTNYLIGHNIISGDKINGIDYVALQNKKSLIDAWYIDRQYNKVTDKPVRKLFNKLKENKLEDCLLYDIALNYFEQENESDTNIKNHILEILQQDIVFTINKNKRNEYYISAPFKDMDKYKQLTLRRGDQSLTERLPEFLEHVKDEQAIKKVWEAFNTNNKSISIKDMNTLSSYLINSASRFIVASMALEEYYIRKNGLTLVNSKSNPPNRLDIIDINFLYDNYFSDSGIK